jgi:hypothetical protein
MWSSRGNVVLKEEKPKQKNVGRQADCSKIVWRVSTRRLTPSGEDRKGWTIEKDSSRN